MDNPSTSLFIQASCQKQADTAIKKEKKMKSNSWVYFTVHLTKNFSIQLTRKQIHIKHTFTIQSEMQKKSCKNHHESSSNSYVYFINIVKLTKKNHYAEKYTFTNSPSQISKTNFNMKKMSVALNIGQM